MGAIDDLLNVARSQLGTGEHPPGSNATKYGAWYAAQVHDQAYAAASWCDEFVSWCADQAGLSAVVGRFAYTPWHAQWFKDNGRWDQKPAKGAIVFFDWGGTHTISNIDHVGIVEAVRSDGSIVTIEGNSGDIVARRVRRTGIAGYGHPAYPADSEDDMPFGQLAEGPQAITPISLPKGRYKSLGLLGDNGLQVLPPATLRVAVHRAGHWDVSTVTVDSATGQAVVTFTDPASTDGISIRREDNGDVHIAWEVS